MSDNVTILREDARKWAGALRDAFDQLGGSAPLVLIVLADLLDPPAASLRDETAERPTPLGVLMNDVVQHAIYCRPGCTGLLCAGAIPPLFDVQFPCGCECHEGDTDD